MPQFQSKFEMKEIKEAFDIFDEDGSGKIRWMFKSSKWHSAAWDSRRTMMR